MDYLPNTLQSTPTDEISPDEHKARSGRYQEIVRKHIRNWRGQCRCDDGNITVIGRRFGDGGLSDRLIEIGIVPTGSISVVLVERWYNRTRAAHRIVLEVMQRMRLRSFKEWL